MERDSTGGVPTTVRSITPFGPDALLVHVERADVAQFVAALRSDYPHLRVHGAEQSALIEIPPTLERGPIVESIHAVNLSAEPAASETMTLRVRYDGPDLAAVGEASGLSAAEVIERHSAATYISMFCGFAPGFSYLSGLDEQLQLPRRATPRTVVPAGSVAIAAHYCAVYPSASPGGWHLIGSCDERLFDASATVPARLPPGTKVRFEPIA